MLHSVYREMESTADSVISCEKEFESTIRQVHNADTEHISSIKENEGDFQKEADVGGKNDDSIVETDSIVSVGEAQQMSILPDDSKQKLNNLFERHTDLVTTQRQLERKARQIEGQLKEM
eukprot:UC4_evm1s486